MVTVLATDQRHLVLTEPDSTADDHILTCTASD